MPTMLATTDGSPFALRALETVAKLAKHTDGLEQESQEAQA